ncbi:MAG TPA: ornithine cyclodeaminase family protein [Thermoanaerobaculia bacterium]|nr:ornithine cyclodeaminase family protein [Thermoanaerobaculia bacterium]
MKLLVLSEHDVERLLTMEECIAVMEEALRALARGEVHNPLRQAIRAPGAPGILGLMPAYRGGERPVYALKEVCVFPGNPARGLDTHLGAVLLHSGETGELLAAVNAAAVTAIRTAAVSAVATKLLARQGAKRLAILGAGVQARSHLEAIRLVRPIEEVRVFSRTPEKAKALGEVAGSAEEAVRGADIIVTATSSREPILRREWIAEGAHINAVGSSIAAARELDSDTVRSASLFVDRRESTVNESGDYLMAGPGVEIRAELGELLLGRAEGRKSEAEITLFKSLGLAVEDLASASFLYDKAVREGAGTWVEF